MLLQKESPIIRGIKAVGVGKKGSRALDSALIDEIIEELRGNKPSAAQKGAFFGALILKGLTDEERRLEETLAPGALQNLKQLTNLLCPETPLFVKNFCTQLLEGKTLTQEEAKSLGRFLFSSELGDGARGMAASILRVRYETPDEYAGLLESLEETFEPPFKEPVPSGDPIIQIAEPFDGVDQSSMITPLVGEFLQKLSYRVVHLVGRNSGPKAGYNLLDIANVEAGPCARPNSLRGNHGGLPLQFLKYPKELADPKPSFGWFLNQQDLSKPMDSWVDIRREIIKRPFLSTLERFVNPVKANILIASAFHAPYGEKMLTICERAGFPAAIIVRNGIEGTIGFPLKRTAKILSSKRQKDGTYLRYEIEFDTEKFLGKTLMFEEKLEHPCAEKNVGLIRAHLEKGHTESEHFDLRVKATCAGLRQAIDWVRATRRVAPAIRP